MRREFNHQLTFAILDKEKGIPDPPGVTDEEFPLPAWYRAVRKTPLENLGIGDLCKACRQEIHLEHIVPLAIDALEKKPLAGELYEGELLAALCGLPRKYWSEHHVEADRTLGIATQADKQHDLIEDVKVTVHDFLTRKGVAHSLHGR